MSEGEKNFRHDFSSEFSPVRACIARLNVRLTSFASASYCAMALGLVAMTTLLLGAVACCAPCASKREDSDDPAAATTALTPRRFRKSRREMEQGDVTGQQAYHGS